MFFEQNKRSPVETTTGLRVDKSLAGSSAQFGGSWVYHIGLVSQRPNASEPAGLFLFNEAL
jgi:hypothetical protein